jgi:hypothetical protein
MDIHPPSGPTHSFKDFAIHILIVTIGILIALGLEGVRENRKEHQQVAEARASFQRELRLNQRQLKVEMAGVRKVDADLKTALTMLPDAAKAPAELAKQVAGLDPGFNIFRTTAWDAAIASGVLSHMDEDEVNRFDEAYLGIRTYQDAQKTALPEWLSVRSWFASHHTFGSGDPVTGEEKLRALDSRVQIMTHVGEELTAALAHSVGP